MSFYTEAKELGVPMDSHESDLYLKLTQEVVDLLVRYKEEKAKSMLFVSEIDKEMWIEIPFAYDPWWENRAKG